MSEEGSKNEERINKALRRFYEFDDHDLEDNRKGKLSAKQLQTIQSVAKERRMLGNLIGGFALVVGGFITAFIVCSVILEIATSYSNAGVNSSTVLGVLGIVALFGVAYYFRRLLLKKANAKGVMRTARGKVHLITVSVRDQSAGRSHKQYQMQIGDALFVLDDELVGKIKEGVDYGVYYLDYQDGSEGIIQSLEKFE